MKIDWEAVEAGLLEWDERVSGEGPYPAKADAVKKIVEQVRSSILRRKWRI